MLLGSGRRSTQVLIGFVLIVCLFHQSSAFMPYDYNDIMYLKRLERYEASLSRVLELNQSNFKSKVNSKYEVVLVQFLAPGCVHCQDLTHIWEKAAPKLTNVATVATLDADAHKSIAQEYGIKEFPTIKVFVDGKPPVDYQGTMDVDAIVDFAYKQFESLLNLPSASVELNASNFDELVLKSNKLWMVDFFAPWCKFSKELAPQWKIAANKLEGKVNLGHVDITAERSLMRRFRVQGFPTILVFGADKDSPFNYEGQGRGWYDDEDNRSAIAIESFALDHLEEKC